MIWFAFFEQCLGQNASRVQLIPFTTFTLSDDEILLGRTDGAATTIAGELRLPRSQAAKFPTVILTPSSDGSNLAVELWANHLNKRGIATFTIDSY